MVLQREPHSPSVWGFGPPGSTVSLSLTGPSSQTPANYEGVVGDDGVWSVSLGSWPAGESVVRELGRMIGVPPRYGVQLAGKQFLQRQQPEPHPH